MKKRIIIFTSIVLAVVIIAVGFKVLVPKNLGVECDAHTAIKYSVKSNKTRFKTDNISLDFYYGHTDSLGGFTNDENFEFIGFALYFYDGDYYDKIKYYSYLDNKNKEPVYEDYRNINGLHLVKELSYDEFNSGDYIATRKLLFGYDLHHQEALTVPKEVFKREEGSFIFMITAVYYVKKDCGYDSGYSLINYGEVTVDYEYINENTIRLSKPTSRTPH